MNTPLEVGTVVDRYTIERPLGEGGMAMVFKVRHNGLGTSHALKVITLNNAEIRRRLVQEGELQGRLQHPNIVSVTDIVELPGGPALVMEFVDGPSLDQLLRARQLTLHQADELAVGLLAGVGAAHARGLVHRDLKPGNILLQVTEEGFVPKIADFGLAKVLSGGATSRTRTGSTMGTPHYMSPEQIRDSKHVGPAADIFSLGCILYEMVCGQRAFDGDDLLDIFNAVAAGRYTPPRDLVPDLPERMDTAIRAALQVDPAQRPADIEALRGLWTGSVQRPVSAFDAQTLDEARSLGSSLGEATPAAEPAPRNQTWAPGPTRSDDAPSSLPDTLGAPRSTSSSVSRLAVVGLGGSVLAALALIGVVALGLVAGAAWYAGRSSADLPSAQTITTPQPVPMPVPVPVPVPDPAPEPETETQTVPAPVSAPPAPIPAVVAAPAPAVPDPQPPAPAPAPAPETAPEPPPAPAPSPTPTPAPTSATPELTPFLASPDPSERKKGIANLAKRGDEEADELLVWELINEPDSTVRQVAFDVVNDRWTARFGDYDELQRGMVHMTKQAEVWAVPALRSFARNGQDPRKLEAALHHHADAVRLAAVEAVASVRPRAPDGIDYEALLGHLRDDPSPAVQRKVNQLLAAEP